jgi:hypothetical protein
MLRHVLSATVVVLACSVAASAAPKDEVADAAKKLADAPNYAWKATTERQGGGGGGGGNFRAGPLEGKTEKGGPMVLAMTLGDNEVQAVVKGDKGAVKTQEGWQSFEELQQSAQQGGQGQGRGRGMFGRMLRNTKAPAQEAQDLTAKSKDITKSGNAYTADLTEEGAKELMTFRGGRGGNAEAPTVTNPKGTVKFWLKDGALSKYEYNVQGSMNFNGNDIEVNRTTTVEVKDVGSTKVEVPEEAKAKLL